ncbi:MAG: radical SAM protein [Deltaproteobacteria bacterium]|nr:radical SAM protein [Deltaproteobacteria bacterium]
MHCYFAISKVCNLRCHYCYVPEYNKNQQTDYDKKALLAVQKFIHKVDKENFHLESVTLHGAEPTILSAKALGETINLFTSPTNQDVRIQSNGTRLTPKYLDDLLEVIKNPNRLFVGISMDGSASIHNSQRNNTWDLITRNIMELRARGFEVGLLAVITRQTLNHLREFGYWVEYMKPLVRGITLKMGEHGYGLNADENARFGEWLFQSGNIKHLQAFMPELCIRDGNQCEFYEFDFEGTCYSCNKNYNDTGTFANWYQDSFKTIIRKRQSLYGAQPVDPECEACSYWSLCQSGCPLSREKGKSVDCLVKKHIYSKLEQIGISKERFFAIERQSTTLAIVRSSFPLLFSGIDKTQGNNLLEDFERQNGIHSIGVSDIPAAFLAFLKEQNSNELSAFFLELADYEHAVLTLRSQHTEIKPHDSFSGDVLLSDVRPVFNPSVTLRNFSYPVHTVTQARKRKLKTRKTELLLWRKPEGVRVLALNAMSARLLNLFLNDSSLTVGRALEKWPAPNEALGILKTFYEGSIIISWASAI